MPKAFHYGTIRRTIAINVSRDRMWNKIRNIAELSWVAGVKSTAYLSNQKSGVGAIRKITFEDKKVVEEHIVSWVPGSHFTYVATDGLPLHVYVATISLKHQSQNSTQITWESYLGSQKMSSDQFAGFLAYMGSFYETSLENLKRSMQ